MAPHYNMLTLVGERPERNASALAADYRPTEPGERRAELRIGHPGKPVVERLRLARRERAQRWTARPRIERQSPLHQRQAADDGTSEKQVDPVDQQRCAVLQLERGEGCHV